MNVVGTPSKIIIGTKTYFFVRLSPFPEASASVSISTVSTLHRRDSEHKTWDTGRRYNSLPNDLLTVTTGHHYTPTQLSFSKLVEWRRSTSKTVPVLPSHTRPGSVTTNPSPNLWMTFKSTLPPLILRLRKNVGRKTLRSQTRGAVSQEDRGQTREGHHLFSSKSPYLL